MTLRFVIVDLRTGAVLADAATLDDALEELDERKLDFFGPGYDGSSAPDYGVIDLATRVMYDDDRGEIVRCWHDSFTGAWRRILEVAA